MFFEASLGIIGMKGEPLKKNSYPIPSFEISSG